MREAGGGKPTGYGRLTDRARGALLGLAVGDAVGTAVEFRARGSFPPVTDMVGGGPFGLRPGQWTDDTSMALCLAASLIEKKGFDAEDQILKYCRWMEQGYMSSTGRCFDIGNATRAALDRFRKTGDPLAGSTDPRSAGNGSIMRLAPVPLFFWPDQDAVERHSAESSRTTHAAAECVDACRLLGRVLCTALAGASREEVVAAGVGMKGLAPRIGEVASGAWKTKTVEQVRGTGYVVESLEAALWCFWTTGSFRDAVLAAVNLGDDADTTAAVCGQIAGAFYGESGIPAPWLDTLAMRQEIADMADALAFRSLHARDSGQGRSNE
jgi:ADP-ribosyl-[dinitrogen reductase] hydrolase